MTLNKQQQLSYKWFGGFVENRVSYSLERALEAAHMNIRGEVYLSFVLLMTLLGLLVTYIVVGIFGFVLLPLMGLTLTPLLILVFLLIPLAVSGGIYLTGTQLPASTAKGRGKRIDLNLSYALNFVSAMSSAGVTPTEIFKSLSKQEVYGEVREEASWIYRDVALLGADIVTAIRNNIERTPSQKFKEFLQGLVVTVTSGGSLKSYFVAKTNQFMWENRQSQRQLIESMGVMAESYVTVAVAGILLMLLVLPLMMIISGDFNTLFMYLLIFMIVPFIHIGFAFVIRSMVMRG